MEDQVSSPVDVRGSSPPESTGPEDDDVSVDGGRIRLLIAEDDDPLRESLVEMFTRLGCRVDGVGTGDEFLERLEPRILGENDHWIPHVIIADVNMPGIPPLQVIDGLRQVGRSVPTIVISGLRDPDVRAMAESIGATWLDKPVAPLELQDTVRCLLAARFYESRIGSDG